MVVHWLTHVSVMLQATINYRVLFVGPFPTTEGLVQSNTWSVVFHGARDNLTASLAHKGVGALRARDVLNNIPRGVLTFTCSPEKFRRFLGDGEAIGA